MFTSLGAVTKEDPLKVCTVSRAVQVKCASYMAVFSLTIAFKTSLHVILEYLLKPMEFHKYLAVQEL